MAKSSGEGNKSSIELTRLLKTYVEKLQELCDLCNINPKSGFPKKNKAMKRIAESLIKGHHEKSDSSDVSTIHDIIKSGTELIENTIKVLEEDLDPVQPCDMSVDVPVIYFGFIKRQEWTKHYEKLVSIFPGESGKYLDIPKLLRKIIDKGSQMTDVCLSMSDHRHDAPYKDSKSVTASNTPCAELPFECKSCSELKDLSEWKLFEPFSDNAQMMYRMNLVSGCYECMKTGLRVECSGDVELEYQTCDWDCVRHDPVMENYSPCGPLMDVKVISGELKKVYLPHFLCLGGSIAKDKVKVLHIEDSGVSLEKCELTRFHAKLLDHNFTLKGLLVWIGFPVNIHCQTLIYQTGKSHLTLHVYLIPNENKMKAAVDKEESTNMLIKKPRPVKSLPMNTWFTLRTLKTGTKSESDQITPEKLQLTYSENYFEAFIKSPQEDFSFQLMAQKNNEVAWNASIRKGDYKKIASTVDGHTSSYSSSGDYKKIASTVDGHTSSYSSSGTGSVFDDLLKCLENLKSEDLQTFTSYLTEDSIDRKEKISRSKLENKAICDIVRCMIDHYQEDGAVEVTLMILKKINQNNLADQLQKKYKV